MQRIQIDPDLAKLPAPEKLRLFLQSIRDGGAAVKVHDDKCWRGSLKLELDNTAGNA